jgi:hypothetical protein
MTASSPNSPYQPIFLERFKANKKGTLKDRVPLYEV